MGGTDGDAVVSVSVSKTLPQGNVLFEKVLSACDVSGGGRVVVPKGAAVEHLPTLESQSGMSLEVLDAQQQPQTLSFRYWINGQSRMYILEGLQTILHQHSMKVGDVLVFSRLQNGKLMVIGRRGTKDDTKRKLPVRNNPAAVQSPSVPPQVKKRGRPPAAVKSEGGERMKTWAKRKPRSSPEDSVPLGPLQDGIFRAVPDGGSWESRGKVIMQDGCWVSIVNLAGEMYQACFKEQDMALEAFNAAVAN